MKHTYEEKLKYEKERLLGNKNAQSKFFGNAITIQNNAWDAGYSKKKMDFACEVLQSTGFCTSANKCEQCKLYRAHEKALNDIYAGLRKPPVKEVREEYDSEYYIRIIRDPKTGIISSVMRPRIRKDKDNE